MSSSTFEVTETENEAEKDLSFGLEACEENGLLSAHIDGEVQKDHTYTKDPDGSFKEENYEPSEEESENVDASPEKPAAKNLKSTKATKKFHSKNTKAKKDLSPQKETSFSKKVKGKKDILAEDLNKSEANSVSEKSEGRKITEEQPKSLRRGKKRKVEEKENLIDRSIVEEVENIIEGQSFSKESSKSPAKKRKVSDKASSKKVKKQVSPKHKGNENLPKGWSRKVVVRKSGKTAGQVDIYIYSPDGVKLRSRPDIAAYLARTKSNLKLEDFNFSKKNLSDNSTIRATPKKEKKMIAVKPKNKPEKKRIKEAGTPKKGAKLVVKLNFTPKSKRGKNAKKMLGKQIKEIKSSKKLKASGSSSISNKKKKTA